MYVFSLQGQTPITELTRKEATITMTVEGVATQEAAGGGAGARAGALGLGEGVDAILDPGAGAGGPPANGDGDSGDCEGAGGSIIEGDGELSDPGADAGGPDGTSDMCGVMAAGEGPGAPVGAMLAGYGANVGVTALGGKDSTGTGDGP